MAMTDTTGTTAPTPTTPATGKAAARAAIDEIAAQFGETEDEPKRLIKRALRTLGEERVRAIVAQALEVETAGGLLLPDGSRRRTPGGVFFYLIRTTVAPKEAYKIVRPQPSPAPAQPQEETQEPAPVPDANG